jgi:hypothetical protein
MIGHGDRLNLIVAGSIFLVVPNRKVPGAESLSRKSSPWVAPSVASSCRTMVRGPAVGEINLGSKVREGFRDRHRNCWKAHLMRGRDSSGVG